MRIVLRNQQRETKGFFIRVVEKKKRNIKWN